MLALGVCHSDLLPHRLQLKYFVCRNAAFCCLSFATMLSAKAVRLFLFACLITTGNSVGQNTWQSLTDVPPPYRYGVLPSPQRGLSICQGGCRLAMKHEDTTRLLVSNTGITCVLIPYAQRAASASGADRPSAPCANMPPSVSSSAYDVAGAGGHLAATPCSSGRGRPDTDPSSRVISHCRKRCRFAVYGKSIRTWNHLHRKWPCHL